jgi:NADH dehydrogenase FAD-containing subunit
MFPQEKLFVNISQLFEQYPKGRFRYIQGTATHLDHVTRSVTVNLINDEIEKFDYLALVIATGASTNSPLLGLTTDEESLRTEWVSFRKALPTARSIVISGGGPAGIETAGELGEYLNGRAQWFDTQTATPKVAIKVITGGTQILPALRPAIAKKAEIHLAKLGVTVIKDTRAEKTSLQGAGRTTSAGPARLTLSNGAIMDVDIYIPAIGTRPNTAFIQTCLLTLDTRVNTNPSTLRVDKAGDLAYAIGDCSSYARPAVHLILNAVPVLCANMRKDLLVSTGKGGGEDRIYMEDKRETQMVSIGKSSGVGAAMGWQLPSWMVWLIKGRDYWLWTTGNLWNGKQWAKEA